MSHLNTLAATTERVPNVPMLRKYVEWVEEQEALPEIDREWDQTWWQSTRLRRAGHLLGNRAMPMVHYANQLVAVVHYCGTTFCLAGKVASDYDPRFEHEEWVDGVHLATVAATLLGLPIPLLSAVTNPLSTDINLDDRAQPLFAVNNTAADIRRIAEEVAGCRL